MTTHMVHIYPTFQRARVAMLEFRAPDKNFNTLVARKKGQVHYFLGQDAVGEKLMDLSFTDFVVHESCKLTGEQVTLLKARQRG